MEQLQAGLAFITGRRRERVARVLVDAADRAGIRVDELLQRLAGDEEREQLLLRTLEAAAGTAMERWLPLYAIALRNGTVAEDLGKLSWETTFVRVVGDLDGAHLHLLDRFTKTANELGLGDGGRTSTSQLAALTSASSSCRHPTSRITLRCSRCLSDTG